MSSHPSRRQWLTRTSAILGTGLLAGPSSARDEAAPASFGFCLNTSTLRGQKLDMVEVVEIAAKAGYQAIEPWLSEIDAHVKAGGNLKELGKRIKDKGLTVASADS